MHHLCLIAMLVTTDVGTPKLPKAPLPTQSLYYVEAVAEATPTNARGLQIISVRLKLKSAGSAPHSLSMKVTAATRDAKTRVDVIYPKGHEDGKFIAYDRDELAIQIIVQRAEGDQSPVNGQVDFGVLSVF